MTRFGPAVWSSSLACALALPLVFAAPALADSGVPLVWQVETLDGKVLSSREQNRPVNPASVVKLASSFRALDMLGPDHRFTTTFTVTEGAASGGARVVTALVVEGGADPDFHFENAVLVAHALQEAGVTRIAGDLYIGETFWIGWERGTVGRETDTVKRRQDMGQRLVQAWNSASWSVDQRRSWSEVAGRRNWDKDAVPSIPVEGRVRTDAPPKRGKPLVTHRSEPLVVALRRFNVFSNNDIERLDASTGPAAELAMFFRKRWGDAGAGMSFSTSSGLNRNRMTPVQIARLVRDLRAWLEQRKLGLSDIMPVVGCGHSTLSELFPRLRKSGEADGLVGKTGTLNTQDGGVSALAGYIPVRSGLVFVVAAPGAGKVLPRARAAEEDWVRRVLLDGAKVPPLKCPPEVPTSDAMAEILL